MTTLRLALVAAFSALALGAATAQTSGPQSTPQIEQSSSGCGWKAKSAATS